MLIDKPIRDDARKRQMRRKGNWRRWLVIIPRVVRIESRGRCLILPFSIIERRFSYSGNRWLYREIKRESQDIHLAESHRAAGFVDQAEGLVPCARHGRSDRHICCDAPMMGRAGDMAQGEG